MSPEAQRIAIAEACGWVFTKRPRSNMMSKIPAWHLVSPSGEERCGKEIWFDTMYGKESVYKSFQGELLLYLDECGVPDYLNDLNAMHEVERTLNKFQCHDYNGRLSDTTTEPPNTSTQCLRWTWGATAAQRAEAFLRVLQLWKD